MSSIDFLTENSMEKVAFIGKALTGFRQWRTNRALSKQLLANVKSNAPAYNVNQEGYDAGHLFRQDPTKPIGYTGATGATGTPGWTMGAGPDDFMNQHGKYILPAAAGLGIGAILD